MAKQQHRDSFTHKNLNIKVYNKEYNQVLEASASECITFKVL